MAHIFRIFCAMANRPAARPGRNIRCSKPAASRSWAGLRVSKAAALMVCFRVKSLPGREGIHSIDRRGQAGPVFGDTRPRHHQGRSRRPPGRERRRHTQASEPRPPLPYQPGRESPAIRRTRPGARGQGGVDPSRRYANRHGVPVRGIPMVPIGGRCGIGYQGCAALPARSLRLPSSSNPGSSSQYRV